jgi:hypothetical protein
MFMNLQLVSRRAMLAIGTAAIALAGCGGGGYEAPPPPPVVLETITAVLTGDQEAPTRVDTGATGVATLSLNRGTRTVSGTVTLDGVIPTAAHIHAGAAGAAGAVVVPLTVSPTYEVTLPATVLTTAQLDSLDAGELYVNIHSAAHAGGEIRGQLGREVYTARLTGAQEATPVASSATGAGYVVLNPKTLAISGEVELSGITATAAHIHTGAFGTNGAVLVGLTDHGGHGHFTVPDNTVLTQAQADALRAGGLYFNAHSTGNAGGEIRGQIGRRVLLATATGAQEVASNASTATGRAFVTYDATTRGIDGSITLTGITATIAHIHMAAAGVNGPVAVSLTETSAGSGVWTVPAGTTLTAAQAQALLEAGMYFNAHSAAFPTGEIRGQLGLQ